MKRIMIIGGAGSGKTTLALKLGDITGLPVVHIDPMYWQEGWVQKPAEETIELACDAAAQDKWIFEGNNSASLPQRIARADMLVFLDVGTIHRLWRIIRRTIQYHGRTRPDMAEGCPERFDWAFFKFAASYHFNGRARALQLIESLPENLQVKHLSRKAEVEDFLNQMKALGLRS